jgi:hypothetical protein
MGQVTCQGAPLANEQPSTLQTQLEISIFIQSIEGGTMVGALLTLGMKKLPANPPVSLLSNLSLLITLPEQRLSQLCHIMYRTKIIICRISRTTPKELPMQKSSSLLIEWETTHCWPKSKTVLRAPRTKTLDQPTKRRPCLQKQYRYRKKPRTSLIRN